MAPKISGTSDGKNVVFRVQKNAGTTTNPTQTAADNGTPKPTQNTPMPAETPDPGGHGNYIGNVHSYKFHRPGCKFLPDEENRIYFDTREEAIAAGYEPCKYCNP